MVHKRGTSMIKSVNKFYTAYNRCLRRLFRLPNTTHTRFLPLLNGLPSAQKQICRRSLTMIDKMKNVPNPTVNYIVSASLVDCNSISRHNRDVMQNIDNAPPPSPDDVCVANAILELNHFTTPLNDVEADELSNFLCTMWHCSMLLFFFPHTFVVLFLYAIKSMCVNKHIIHSITVSFLQIVNINHTSAIPENGHHDLLGRSRYLELLREIHDGATPWTRACFQDLSGQSMFRHM